MSEVKRDYQIGYGKPPRGGPFQKGQSGNPRGPHRKDMSALLTVALERAGLCHDRWQAAQDHQAPGDHHANSQRIGERQPARDQDAVRHDERGRAEGRSCGTARAGKTVRHRSGNRRSVCRAAAPPDRRRSGPGGGGGRSGSRRYRRTNRLTMTEPTVAGDTDWSECAAMLRDDFASSTRAPAWR